MCIFIPTSLQIFEDSIYRRQFRRQIESTACLQSSSKLEIAWLGAFRFDCDVKLRRRTWEGVCLAFHSPRRGKNPLFRSVNFTEHPFFPQGGKTSSALGQPERLGFNPVFQIGTHKFPQFCVLPTQICVHHLWMFFWVFFAVERTPLDLSLSRLSSRPQMGC